MSGSTQAPSIRGVEGPMRIVGRWLALVALGLGVGSLGFGAAGCASRPRTEALPRIVIQPGAAERIALMDRYRLNDDLRKRAMVRDRPHTWVEEVPEDELPPELRNTEPPPEPEPEPQADATSPDR